MDMSRDGSIHAVLQSAAGIKVFACWIRLVAALVVRRCGSDTVVVAAEGIYTTHGIQQNRSRGLNETFADILLCSCPGERFMTPETIAA
jgi:hypothetical protein